MKVADVASNYKVDKVLYASCKPLIEGRCKMDLASESSTLTCLMNNMDGPDMTDDCEQRLIEVRNVSKIQIKNESKITCSLLIKLCSSTNFPFYMHVKHL